MPPCAGWAIAWRRSLAEVQPPVPDAEERSQRSLFGDILDWMLVPLLLLWPLSVLIIWVVAQGIANRPFDRELGELAHTLSRRVSVAAAPASRQGPAEPLRDGPIRCVDPSPLSPYWRA